MSVAIADVYARVTDRLLETGGFQLGIFTYAQFLLQLADVCDCFLRETGVSKMFATQTINQFTGQYSTPPDQAGVEQVFVAGRFIPRSSLESINNTTLSWKSRSGQPKVWHEDGLPINSIELVLSPSWQGALYASPDQSAPSQFKYIRDEFFTNIFSGTVNATGNLIQWVSGSQFNGADSSFYGQPILINYFRYVIESVQSPTALTLTSSVPVPVIGVAYLVQYPIAIPSSDRNLTTYGPRISGSSSNPTAYIPAAAGPYLAWGVLARIYSSDNELKDEQKAAYCSARFEEGISIFRRAALESLADEDYE